jgi:Synuclein
LKVKGGPAARGFARGFSRNSYHRGRSQVMSNTSGKMKDGIHDAAEKVKDAAHNVAEKTKDVVHNVGEKLKDAGR